MSAFPSQSPGAASASRRDSLTPTPAPAQLPSRRRVSLTPDDEYDYHDAGPSVSPTNPQQQSGDPNSVDASGDRDRFAEEVAATIYEKATNSNRAKLPDDNFAHANGHLPAPNAQPNAPTTAAAPSRRRRRDFFSASKSQIIGRAPRSAEDTSLWKIELHWSREEAEGVKKVSFNASMPNNDTSEGSKNSVIWQHSNYESIRLEELEDLLTNLHIHGLQESGIGLTKRLINRIGLVSERSFVHGRFLNPTAIRYDMLDDSKYNKDKCSIFLSFPYFAVKKPGEKPSAFSKGAPEHPTRTLLQSRYRLNETVKRDESQCITELTGDKLKSCTKVPYEETAHLTRKKVEELIYVPQLWTLIIGLDHMITAGPIKDTALHGSTLMLKNAGTVHRCSFVQISFVNRDAVESAIYPIAQCKSWFGLLNVHQQLRNVLAQGKEKVVPKHFKLRIGLHTLTGGTWASVQRSTQSEVLKIWMDTPKLPAFSFQGADGKPVAEQQDGLESDTESLHDKASAETAMNQVYEESLPVPVIKPFLEWHLLDDFGNRDESAPMVKVNRFLYAIYYSLSAVCTSQSTLPASQTAQVNQPGPNPNYGQAAETRQMNGPNQSPHIGSTLQVGSTHANGQNTLSGQSPPTGLIPPASDSPQAAQMLHTQTSGSGRPNISVIGRTSKDVDDLTYQLQNQPLGEVEIIPKKLRRETAKIFSYYVPAKHDETLAPVRLFWGLLYELIEHRQNLHPLYEKIRDINKWAERLHLGVYYQHRSLNDTGAETFENAVSDYAILQAKIIDAMGAIFNMLVAAVRESRSGQSTDPNVTPWKRALRHGTEVCKSLEEARDKLIAEAMGSAPSESLGPVTTPEAIMIMLLERLAHGVYGSGTVDVINIFEECLEQLAFDVEKRPSRRLLKRINAFQEEVDIVNSVLLQQHKVLIEFRKCLDPAKFKRPTTARKIRFQFEESGIDRITTHILEQRRYVAELVHRATVLENQNVRLVETLADDNSRAIFMFTFITILFLPLSFVASFFGMNLVGINQTTQTVSHFWVVGAPLTGGIMLICVIFVFRGEDVWFFLADLPGRCVDLLRGFGVGLRHSKEKIS